MTGSIYAQRVRPQVIDNDLGQGVRLLLRARIEPKIVRVDWRKPSLELFAVAGEGFSLVLAADVLYDAEDAKPLLALLDRIVAPDGELWLAEPGRPASEQLVKALRERGWHGTHETCDSPWPDPLSPANDRVNVHCLDQPPASQP